MRRSGQTLRADKRKHRVVVITDTDLLFFRVLAKLGGRVRTRIFFHLGTVCRANVRRRLRRLRAGGYVYAQVLDGLNGDSRWSLTPKGQSLVSEE